MKLRIKYFDNAKKLEIVEGKWIEVYASKDVFVKLNERAMIPLGFALELPKGWEGHLALRNPKFRTEGIIETNGVGIIDDSSIGDDDQWFMPIFCLNAKDINEGISGTWINKGDKIGKFRIVKVMPSIDFEEVDTFGNKDRGGFGSTGKR